jgi:hypothetical protein
VQQCEPPERPEPGLDSPDFWHAYHTLPINEFFEEWKTKFLSLEWVAIPGNVDDGVLLYEDAKIDVSQFLSRVLKQRIIFSS